METQRNEMHPTQARYAVAKAAHDAAWEACRAELEELEETDDIDADLEAEAQIEERHGVDRYGIELFTATEALLDWYCERMRSSIDPANTKHVEIVEALPEMRCNAKTRDRMIELAMRLQA